MSRAELLLLPASHPLTCRPLPPVVSPVSTSDNSILLIVWAEILGIIFLFLPCLPESSRKSGACYLQNTSSFQPLFITSSTHPQIQVIMISSCLFHKAPVFVRLNPSRCCKQTSQFSVALHSKSSFLTHLIF